MCWRDFVCNNFYGQEIVYSFLCYFFVGMFNVGFFIGFEDDIVEYDGSVYLDDFFEFMYYYVFL